MDESVTFSPDELMPLIPSSFFASSFLQMMFFGGMFEFDTAEVYFDRVLDDMRPAPYVAPLGEGSVLQSRGYQKETIVPAALKPLSEITGKEVLSRLAGEAIGGEMSAADREAAIREQHFEKHLERIRRQLEIQASSILRTGAVTITGDGYPSAVVDYDRDNSLTKTLTLGARWGQSGVSPYNDLDDWMDQVGEASGSAVDVVVMDRHAWRLFSADQKTKDSLDRTLGQNAALALGFTPTTPGVPAFKGRDGNVEFYVYNQINHNSSYVAERLLPDYTVIAGSRAGFAGAKLCGVVQHAENHFEKGEFFPHEWIEQKTGAHWVETITASILAPKRINASLCATVN